MTTYTPYLRLSKPPFDTVPWDEAVNGNMDTIDAFIAQYMSVPNYAGAWNNGVQYLAGQTLLDLDNNTLYQAQVTHVSSAWPTTFAQDRVTYPSYWAQTGTVPPVTPETVGDIGRNLIHNPLFNIAQRGVGPFTATNYTLDRWLLQTAVGSSASVIQNSLSDSNRTTIDDEAAERCLYNTFTGASGAGNFIAIQQSIENVRRLGGKTVTVSFWAAASSTLKLGVSIDQSFGTGGSPSGFAGGVGQSVTVTTAVVRYSMTFAVPSTSGKVLGTNGDSSTKLVFWYSSDPSISTRSGGVPVQNGAIWLWGVQLEIGSAATLLEKPDPRYDLSNCQRFYQIGQVGFGGSANGAASNVFQTQPLAVQMRVAPTLNYINSAGSNITSQTVNSNGSNSSITSLCNVTAAGFYYFQGSFTASADL